MRCTKAALAKYDTTSCVGCRPLFLNNSPTSPPKHSSRPLVGIFLTSAAIQFITNRVGENLCNLHNLHNFLQFISLSRPSPSHIKPWRLQDLHAQPRRTERLPRRPTRPRPQSSVDAADLPRTASQLSPRKCSSAQAARAVVLQDLV